MAKAHVIISGSILVVFLAAALCPVSALAEGLEAVGSSSSAESAAYSASSTAADPDLITKTIQNTNKFGLEIAYNKPVCGQPTSFSIRSTDESEAKPYKYMMQTVYITDRDGREYLIDPTRQSYGGVGERDFSFTFHASGSYEVYFYAIDAVSYQYGRPFVLNIVIDDPNHPSVEATADVVAAERLAAGMETDYEKALWVHDWVLDHCTYDNSLTYCSAEGVLARGTGTCETYHRAYVRLLDRLGVESRRVTGNGRVWTLVKMGGNWCHVDPTWDDVDYSYTTLTRDDMRHMYFGMTDGVCKAAHSDHRQPIDGCEASSAGNS
ncbi:transglutaminase domain-containing protein [Adlercreutzia sp. ZJ242]|uniref:transglutaminase domain-containing protein n=1 Tax=Adlercreutzia sp. ZJ242 TaxID=2709409 RepID=UPI0013EC14D6|nr:transglutaminase-like domain-containing protein [Adlercreutzia sp. ZJ242]